MDPARIAELLAPYLSPDEARRLPPAAFDDISTYIDILARWNARINLTAIRDPEHIVTRHFGESLFAARHLFPDPSASSASSAVNGFADARRLPPEAAVALADLGSGAGFPGIPIKLWAPEIALTLIESNHKKATFLREVARTLTLTDINILAARAETLPPSQFDVVTLRAVERFEQALPTAARLVKPAGRLALLIGSAQLDQVHATRPAIRWSPPIPIPNSSSRVLLIGSETGQP
jgi:16S rRNA (guanine527-N7)-methyltransferase